MGNISSVLKALSCNSKCASDCSLNDELKELKKFVKNLAEEDLREIRDYFLEREKYINKKKEALRGELRRSIAQREIVI